MDEDTSTFGLNVEKLIRFLRIGAEEENTGDKAGAELSKADLLKARLNETFPLDPKELESIPTLLRHFYQELLPLAGQSLGAALLNPKTALQTIVKIKEYSKMLGAAAQTEAEKDTAVVIYYASIAHALVHQRQKISEHTYQYLEEAIDMLLEKTWIPQNISDLISQAQRIAGEENRESSGGSR